MNPSLTVCSFKSSPPPLTEGWGTHAIKMNKSGYYMVSKMKEPRLTQGFVWRYHYYEDGKRKDIMSIDLDKLEKKVKEKGLKWRRL